MPLNPPREAMSLKPEAIKAYELERTSGYKLDRVSREAKP
jgi:hypothetical protein